MAETLKKFGSFQFVIRLLEFREQLCDIVFENMVWCHSENNASDYLKSASFVKRVPDFENPKTIPALILLDDFMNSAYSTKVSQLFTQGSYHHNISLVLITQNVFHQITSSGGIFLSNKYIVVFRNTRDKTEIVHLARQVYPENISSFQKMYLDL